MTTRYGACILCLVRDDRWMRGAQTPNQAPPRLVTRWAKEVRPDNVWPEYPRPQMVRPAWQNLNGLWHYAITARETTPAADAYRGDDPRAVCRRVVPERRADGGHAGSIPVVSHARFKAPDRPAGGRVLLHFGAVDWEAVVSVNGKQVGEHRGGYDPFTVRRHRCASRQRRSGDRRSRLGSDR